MARRVLRNCFLIDGITSEPVPDAVVAVEGDRIEWVGPAGVWADSGTDDESVDMQGAYVLPGLWDMHVHLWYRQLREAAAPLNAAEDAILSYRRALTFLHHGVTTIRLTGTANGVDFSLRDCINRGEVIGPRLLTAGPGISSTGGHGSTDGKGFDGPYEFRRAARSVLWRGADLVKIMVTGGIAGRHEAFDAPQTLEDEVRAAVEVAHHGGKHVAGHVASSGAAKMCMRAGMDTIEHGYALDREALTAIGDGGGAYVPTLVVTDDPSYWTRIGTPEWAVSKIIEARPSHRRAASMAMEMGVTVAVGTDIPTTFIDGALVTVREMEVMEGLGGCPRMIVGAATSVPAGISGLTEDVGTLQPGKVADVIAVPANPYESVSCLRDVSFVMSKGVVVRDDLSDRGEAFGALIEAAGEGHATPPGDVE